MLRVVYGGMEKVVYWTAWGEQLKGERGVMLLFCSGPSVALWQ